MSSSSSRVLVVTPDNPRDCTILNQETGNALYTVYTELDPGKGSITTLKDSGGQVIASWSWTDYVTDRQLTLGNHEPVETGAWLKKSSVPFKSSVATFPGNNGDTKYTWKTGHSSVLELYAESDSKHPIAQFTRTRKKTGSSSDLTFETTATLTLDSLTQPIQDFIVISLLILEKTNLVNGPAKDPDGHGLATAVAIIFNALVG
ncbi:hypothetical protein BKA70DRAFT_1268343 [Coprinopsis sp. MPI-PUGE-AT-0042]|nr:hypothetical protein BKA70DRAFT_1268343 [Coprinopsis sp. MPI-PUGE-AT-0042]